MKGSFKKNTENNKIYLFYEFFNNNIIEGIYLDCKFRKLIITL